MAREKSAIAKQVECEHVCIQRDMGRIREEISRDIPVEEFDDWRLEFLWRLRDFRLHVMKHIDLEEEGGFMHEILEEAPEVANEVNRLEHEHDNIVMKLDDLLVVLRTLERKDDTEIASLREGVLDLLKMIFDHEDAENELIQKAYYQVYGYPA